MGMLTEPRRERRALRKVNPVIDPDSYTEPHVPGWAAAGNSAGNRAGNSVAFT